MNTDITNINTATVAMELLNNKEMKKFVKKFAGVRKPVSNKTAKTQAKREMQHTKWRRIKWTRK